MTTPCWWSKILMLIRRKVSLLFMIDTCYLYQSSKVVIFMFRFGTTDVFLFILTLFVLFQWLMHLRVSQLYRFCNIPLSFRRKFMLHSLTTQAPLFYGTNAKDMCVSKLCAALSKDLKYLCVIGEIEFTL